MSNTTSANTTTTETQNAEARRWAIAQLQAAMDSDNAKRDANRKAHLEAESAKWND